ncbi:MAG: DUF2752 domain-containing protein [Actinomycetota bacterium]|nr:DUF2752 domain-containing protein [Actinomycetota bacterium]
MTRPVVQLRWSNVNGHRLLAPLAAAGLVLAAGLAVFGLPPLDLHGPLHRVGVMDPACGLTRGVRAVARGDLGLAWSYNPGSPALVVAALGLVVRDVVGRITGRWLNVHAASWPVVAAVAGVAVIALWINQQAHAGLLMGP